MERGVAEKDVNSFGTVDSPACSQIANFDSYSVCLFSPSNSVRDNSDPKVLLNIKPYIHLWMLFPN